jgi:allantoate deiminase
VSAWQHARAQQAIARCREIARCSEVEGETMRTFLAPCMRQVHELMGGWMRAAGMEVRVDAVGNLRGVLSGAETGAPRLLIGSHLDTVADAGAYDGVLGVVMGVALCEEIAARRQVSREQMPFAIEVVGFSEEEGVRFAKPFLGSLALIGEMDEAILACADANGTSVVQAIRDFGLEPSQLAAVALDPSTFAYVEFHIEQGPVLEAESAALAVVDAVAGQTRATLAFTGHANHAGTTPMGRLRHDALAAAAAWITEVERYASGIAGLVATVGKLDIPSAAGNVIPGRVVATLDVRHAQDAVRAAGVDHLVAFAETAAASRGVTLSSTITLDQPAVPMDSTLTRALSDCVTGISGGPARVLTSGAGHDAMILARRVPSAMVFLRSPGGLSHHPDETVLVEDVEAALSCGLEFLSRLRDDKAMLDPLVHNARTYGQHRLAEARHA